ncbi:MAG TPA: hypothetical protein VFM99_00115 [Chitinophagales bacterium]|nr:hypothetical protein [Chitinophagales bacterium]
MKWNKQLSAVLVGIILVLVLYVGLSNKPPKKTAFDTLRESLIDTSHIPNLEKIITLEAELQKAKGPEKEAKYEALSHQWEHAGYLTIAGDYLRQKANAFPTYENYMEAGQTLFNALNSDTTENMQVNLVYSSRYCYEKAMELKPGDADAQIGLATVLVQGTNEPMKGIIMLREVLAKDSLNINANIELGRFSMMSGLYDKAIERFNAVLQKDSLHLQSRYFLAEGYLGLSDTTAAINQLEKIIEIEQDTMVQNRIQLYINYLKKL